MAARRRLAQTARTRDSIRTAHLIRRLEAFALGENAPRTGQPVRMTRDQIRSAEVLLRKTLPDLRSVELKPAPGSAGGFLIMGVHEAPSAEAWLAEHAPGAAAPDVRG